MDRDRLHAHTMSALGSGAACSHTDVWCPVVRHVDVTLGMALVIEMPCKGVMGWLMQPCVVKAHRW